MKYFAAIALLVVIVGVIECEKERKPKILSIVKLPKLVNPIRIRETDISRSRKRIEKSITNIINRTQKEINRLSRVYANKPDVPLIKALRQLIADLQKDFVTFIQNSNGSANGGSNSTVTNGQNATTPIANNNATTPIANNNATTPVTTPVTTSVNNTSLNSRSSA